jgi:hypothetical protein
MSFSLSSRFFRYLALFLIFTTTLLSCSGPVKQAFYYIDAQKGSDSNPGTQDSPWKSIQKAADRLPAGATVFVQAGTYPELVMLTKSKLSFIAVGQVYMNGFYVEGDNNLVRGFIISNPDSDFGLRVSGDNNVFEKNEISNTKQDGVWFFGAGNRFTSNYIHDILDRSLITNDPHVDCFQTWGPAENIIIEKNLCDHTSTTGSNQIIQISNENSPVRNILFKNNVFIMHSPGYSPMNFHRQDGQDVISEMYVINNTIVHANGGGKSGIRFSNITGAYAFNNLFVDYGYGEADIPYILIEGQTSYQLSNNALYKSDHFMPGSGMYAQDIWLDELRVTDLTGHNFHPQNGSPIIDAGMDVSQWIVDDFDGIKRPQGSAFDIGAFEFVSK